MPLIQPRRPVMHPVLQTPLDGPWPGCEQIYVAMGCFWGAEKLYWQLPGVTCTRVGYMGGTTTAPSYDDVCSGATGHAETVHVIYDPSHIDATKILATFWESHDPTQGMRQGNDIGSQYRSAVFWTTPEQQQAYEMTREVFARALADTGYSPITTEADSASNANGFWPAEPHHQQYLHDNPGGYCPTHATGLTCDPD